MELDASLLYVNSVNFPSHDIFVKLLGKLTVLASEEAFITNLVHVGGIFKESAKCARNRAINFHAPLRVIFT